MKRLSVRSARPLKVIHLTCVAIWIGGVAAWLPLVFGTHSEATADGLRTTYLSLRAIAWNVVGWGGIGSFVSGTAMGGLTTWGLFRRPWIIAKLVMTVCGVLFGMFFIERNLLQGLAALEASGTLDEQIARNHRAIEVGLVCQLVLFLAIIAVSVFKPGERRSRS